MYIVIIIPFNNGIKSIVKRPAPRWAAVVVVVAVEGIPDIDTNEMSIYLELIQHWVGVFVPLSKQTIQ